MRRQWILIDQSFLKTIRTIEDKIISSSGGEENATSHKGCEKARAVLGASDCNGLMLLVMESIFCVLVCILFY